MLLNQNQTESTATNTYITPQELAQAIAAVEVQEEAEAQKQAEINSLTGTIQAIGLDVTPEELRAAVHAQREHVRKHQQLQRAKRGGGMFFLLPLLIAGAISSYYVWNIAISMFSAYPRHTYTATLPQNPVANLTPLALAAENQPVYVSFSDIVALANGKSAQEILAAPTIASTASGTRQWTILKFCNHYFVRGWRYRTDGENKQYADWLASIPRDVSAEETGETPIERFKSINQPPSIADDSAQQGEQVNLPASGN